MYRRLARISNAYQDLSDRYGLDDPLVLVLKEQLERRRKQAEDLPFGERRRVLLAPAQWNQRLRPVAHPQGGSAARRQPALP